MFLSFLNALPVSSSILLSALIHVSRTEVPALHKATVSLRIPANGIGNEMALNVNNSMPITVDDLSCHFIFCDDDVLGDGGDLLFVLGTTRLCTRSHD